MKLFSEADKRLRKKADSFSAKSKEILILLKSIQMKGTHLGEFEELVLLTVALLYDEAYGVAIQRSVKERANRSVSISTVHSTLHRLEKKGFVNSRYGGASSSRGGRRKHLFRVTVAGEKALLRVRKLRNELWEGIPKLAFGSS